MSFANDRGDPPTMFHMAMSPCGDSMIEALQGGDVVKIEQRVSQNSYWAPKFIGELRMAS